ncbi:hypothetical protein [Phenylobacterium sp.]|uniref:hypothetical protein n=1 Tax=Phenylobacterium sp. TaxID=1871053 RepID=UPI0011FB9EDA|nr:hypothetical protein [Phenylobacterium sp.]THD65022.1 MAG: hypothetical protein E8A49_00485 [Phenylobacterium sp.]
MAFIFLVPAWLLALAAAVGMLRRPASRVSGIYLALAATGALAGSFLLPTALLLAVSNRALPHWAGFAALVGYVAALVVGGLLGAAGGLWVAQGVVRRLRP